MKTNGNPAGQNVRLIEHVGELMSFSSGLLLLAEMGPDRMTAAQSTFFMYAGLADLYGRPATFTELREKLGPVMSRSLHTTYKLFLGDEGRDNKRAQALGWLYRETDPSDNRRKYLRLTKEGRFVMEKVVKAITGESI